MDKYLELLSTFFKLGIFTFGGGYNMIPLLEEELVNKKKWIQKEKFYDYLALETLVPGSVAVNMASFIGYHKYKLPGLLAATIGVILPSIIVISFLSYYIYKYRDNEYTFKLIEVLKPTLLALILITFIRLFNNTFKTAKNKNNFKISLFLILTFVAIYNYNINPIYVILFNVMLGMLI